MASKRDQRTRINVIKREKYKVLRKAGLSVNQVSKARNYSDKKVNMIIHNRNKKNRWNKTNINIKILSKGGFYYA